MGLGGYSPAPEFVGREARAAGAMEPGSFRVIAVDRKITHQDFKTLQEARQYADDVASEADYDDVPPAAYIVDSSYECIDIGTNHAIRKDGKSAWESYSQRGRQAGAKPAVSAPGGGAEAGGLVGLLRRFWLGRN